MFHGAHAELSGVGRIRRSRHPAMAFACGFGGLVPFTMRAAEYFSHWCGERDKGSGRAPLVNPRGPARKSVLRTALTSCVPDCGRLDSTYSSHPWDSPLRGQRKRCSKLLPAILSLSRFASVRHPWRPDLVIHASVRRFQRGHNPIAFILQIKAKTVSLIYCRMTRTVYPAYAVLGASLS